MKLKLRCYTCDNTVCDKARRYIPEDSLEGCLREVSDEDYETYYHYMSEILPMLPIFAAQGSNVDDSFNEIFNFLNKKVYQAPFVKKLDRRGKVKP